MSVYKDKNDNRWRWRRRGVKNPFTGEKFEDSGTPEINSKKAAEEAERAWVESVTIDPKLRPISRDAVPFVKDVAGQFYRYMEGLSDKSPTYLLKLEGTIRNHIIPDLGEHRIDEVTDSRLREWKNKLIQKPRGLRGPALKAAQKASAAPAPAPAAESPVTPSLTPQRREPLIQPRTVKDILRVCHGMFVYAVEEKLLALVPKFPKPPAAIEREPVYLEIEETTQLYAAARNDEERLLLMFAIQTGLRMGEQMALRWTDIDFEKGQITVRRTYKKNKKGASPKRVLGPPKGKKERTLDVVPSLIDALRRARNLKPLVFSREDATYFTPEQLAVVLRRTKAKAGITKPFRWHDLRHTYGSHVASVVENLRTLQKWMGHKSITTTEMYAHFMPKRGAEHAAALTKIWG